MSDREGPAMTDENGDLKTPYLPCAGCKHLRVHDFHYFYCRDLGDKTKPDFDPYNNGLARLWHFPNTGDECSFKRG